MIEHSFKFNQEKNLKLIEERGISFEEIITMIDEGMILDIILHPDQNRYPGQKIYIIEVESYCYLVPFIQNGSEIFLKTIIPSRKATKLYGGHHAKEKNTTH